MRTLGRRNCLKVHLGELSKYFASHFAVCRESLEIINILALELVESECPLI